MLSVHGKRIRVRRQVLQLSIEDVACHCDCSVIDIEQAEKAGLIEPSTFKMLCEKLKCPRTLFEVDERPVVLPTGFEFKTVRESSGISVVDMSQALGLSRVIVFAWEKHLDCKIKSSRIRLAGELLNQPWGLPLDNA